MAFLHRLHDPVLKPPPLRGSPPPLVTPCRIRCMKVQMAARCMTYRQYASQSQWQERQQSMIC